MGLKVFVTGTDTAAGKTAIAAALLLAANEAGLTTAGLKPVAAGGVEEGDEVHNDDALLLQECASLDMTYAEVNPVCFKAPMAPHIAARQEGRQVTSDQLVGYSQGVFAKSVDLTVVEGAGGWRVPLNERELMSEYVKKMNMPVILVVALRLGCLNHARLTAEAILRDGLPLAGWVANTMDPDMLGLDENRQSLAELIPAPCLGVVPWLSEPDPVNIQPHLDFEALKVRLSDIAGQS